MRVALLTYDNDAARPIMIRPKYVKSFCIIEFHILLPEQITVEKKEMGMAESKKNIIFFCAITFTYLMSNILKSEDILRKMTYSRNKKVILPSETT